MFYKDLLSQQIKLDLLFYTTWYIFSGFVVIMVTKAEKTSEFIIQKVAPIFNKHGYSGTSMSDLTNATKLTKGAFMETLRTRKSSPYVRLPITFKAWLIKLNFTLGKLDLLLANCIN
jgi:hypothetical protein